jgi:hypothetical protein
MLVPAQLSVFKKLAPIVNTPIGGCPSLRASVPMFIIDPAGTSDIKSRVTITHLFISIVI